MEVEVCTHHQRGYCKFQEECQKYHEHEICEVNSCFLKYCRRRYPKLCKYFRERECANTGKDALMHMLSKSVKVKSRK